MRDRQRRRTQYTPDEWAKLLGFGDLLHGRRVVYLDLALLTPKCPIVACYGAELEYLSRLSKVFRSSVFLLPAK